MKDSGFVKLNRSILEWEWFQDSNAVHVLVYLLAAVNRLPGRWQGIDIAPGSIVTSRAKISAATGMSEKQVRLALDKLEQCGTITRDGAGKGQLVTLVKWAEYQIEAPREGRERAGRGPDEGRERATILEGKKEIQEEVNTEGAALLFKKETVSEAKVVPLPFTSEAFALSWAAFEQMRKAKRKPMTERARALIIADLIKMGETVAIQQLDLSTRNGWTDVYWPKPLAATGTTGLNMARPELNATRRDLKTTWD